MACDIELLQELPDPPDFVDDLDNFDDPGDDWVSLLLDEESAALGDFDPLASLADILPQTPGPNQPSVHRQVNPTASPSSGLTHLSGSCSPSSSQEDNLKEEEAAGSGTEQCRSDGEHQKQTASANPSSSGESNCRTSKKLGKRKIIDYEEEIKPDDGEVDEEELKRRARLMRNRESAQLSRQRKKAYVDDLEERVRTLNATVAELNNTVNLISAENVNLRNQLAYFYHSNNGAAAKPGTFAPPVGMPMFPYPGGYVTRPMRPGSSAPPVPIPRLKTQASSVKSVKRAKASKEDGQKKTGTGKTKKLASVAALGFLCIMMFVFPFDLGVPGFQSRTVETTTTTSYSWSQASVVHSGAVNRIGGRVLMSLEKDGNNTDRMDWGPDDRCSNANRRGAVHIDGSIFPANVSTYGNASDRFPASLILPQDNRMVKIDGDLIIQAVMAGDKAASDMKNTRGLGRQAKEVSHAPPALMNSFQEIAAKALLQKQRALPASDGHQALPSGDDVKPDLQQAMLNELAGTVFSTGLCSEVFQFEISPGTSESGVSAEPASNPASQGKRSGGHRRNLSAVPIPSEAASKRKKYNSSTSSAAGGFTKKRPSSMVVSIFNPKQVQSTGAKDLARIFVVVLVDSVKYVTYSCLLPPQPQVVTG